MNCFFFDLGNTLTVSYSLQKSFQETKCEGVEPEQMALLGELFEQSLKDNVSDSSIQKDWKEIFAPLIQVCDIQISCSNNLEHFVTRLLGEYTKKCYLENYSISLLQHLSEQNKTLSLVSNVTGPAPVFNQHLEYLGIRQFFQSIIWSADIGYRKPSKEIFAAAIKASGADVSESIFIGDSEKADIVGAKNAGMKAILLINNNESMDDSQADWIIRKENILSFIKKHF